MTAGGDGHDGAGALGPTLDRGVAEPAGTRRRGPLRKPVALLLAAAGAATLVSKREQIIGGDPDDGQFPREPVPLDALDAGQLTVTLPADADRASASDVISEQLAVLRSTGRGGTLHLPPGEWVLDRPIRLDVPDLRLVGAGIRSTRVRMGDGVSANLVEVDAPGVTVERLTLIGVGADDPDGAGHGIRVGSSATDVLVRDLVIEGVPSYGIGLQPRDSPVGDRRVAGLFDGICLRNVVIRGCGQDGIDVKNIDERVDACRSDDLAEMSVDCNGRRSFFRNLTVSEVGLRAGEEGEKPAIDIRGIRSLQNIEMIGLTGGAFGVRFRNDAGGPPNGLGGSDSTIENFVVLKAAGGPPGVELSGTTGVEVHNGFVVEGDDVETFA